MAEIELLYFNIHGRGLLIRMLLKMGEIEFKDTQLAWKSDEFLRLKPSKTKLYQVLQKIRIRKIRRIPVFKIFFFHKFFITFFAIFFPKF